MPHHLAHHLKAQMLGTPLTCSLKKICSWQVGGTGGGGQGSSPFLLIKSQKCIWHSSTSLNTNHQSLTTLFLISRSVEKIETLLILTQIFPFPCPTLYKHFLNGREVCYRDMKGPLLFLNIVAYA